MSFAIYFGAGAGTIYREKMARRASLQLLMVAGRNYLRRRYWPDSSPSTILVSPQ